MLGWFSDARTSASRWNRASLSTSDANASGRTLIATDRFRFESVRAVDLAHAAHTDLSGYLIRAEAGALDEPHMRRILRGVEGRVTINR